MDMMETGASFDELLRDCRLAAGLTQEALAEQAGLSARNIRALEHGSSKPQRETARRLATALGLGGQDLARFLVVATSGPRHRPTPRERAPDLRSLPVPVTGLVSREGELAAVLTL